MTKIIVLEGPDGVGKTTQAVILHNVLRSMDYRVELFSQPSGEYRNKVYDKRTNEMSRVMYTLLDYAEKLQHIGDSNLEYAIMDRSPFMSVLAYNMQKLVDSGEIFAIENLLPEYAARYNLGEKTHESLYIVFNKQKPIIESSASRDGIFADYDYDYLFNVYNGFAKEHYYVPVEKLYEYTEDGKYSHMSLVTENPTQQEVTLAILDILRERNLL